MRFLATILVTALLAWLASWLVGWWMLAVIPFIMAIFTGQKPGRAFISGMLSIALFWAVVLLIVDARNEYLLSSRMAALFGLAHPVFILVNILLGGLVGGLGGWSGACLARFFRQKK